MTKENGDIIRLGILNPICSVFTAELAAILESVMYVQCKKVKFINWADSNITDALMLLNPHAMIKMK